MTETMRIGCKINLYLEITGMRADGYHELETLFYPVPEPHDTLELGPDALPSPDGRSGTEVVPGLRLWCSEAELETPSNIVAKAYEAYAAKTGYRPPLTVRLTKGIPHGAGLGGGSADAAAMLGHLNRQAGDKALCAVRLAALATRLGADVPFFLLGRPAWATGIGEVLKPSKADLSGFRLVLAVPRERVNTAWAYRVFDEAHGIVAGQGTREVLTRLAPAGMRPFCVSGAFIANCFENVVFGKYPSVRLLKERLMGLGAASAGMSGSGSAVFGLFRRPTEADAAVSALTGPEAAVFSADL